MSMFVFVLTTADEGFVKMKNHGLYVASFSLKYTKDGKEVTKSTDPFWLFHSRILKIPDGATNIYVKAEEFWFIGLKKTIFEKPLDKPDNYCYKLHGFTYAPSHEQYSLFCMNIELPFGSNEDEDDSKSVKTT